MQFCGNITDNSLTTTLHVVCLKRMQTFLPFEDFYKSISCLDYQRLGKQRVEAFQLLIVNGDEWALAERQWRIDQGLMKNSPLKSGWVNHPAAIMWRGYDEALRLYLNTAIIEWVHRGYNNTMRKAPTSSKIEMPPWVGWSEFHASHRANLLRKNPTYYGQFGWKEDPGLPYIWPVSELLT